MWPLSISVGPTCPLGGTDVIRVRAWRNLDETDYTNSVRPILVITKQRVGLANSVGPIRSFGWTETLQKGNREFALQSRWDRSLISVRPKHYEGKQRVCNPISVRPRSLSMRPNWLGFLQWLCQLNSVAPDDKLRWGRVGLFGLGHMWKWESSGWGLLAHITKHFEQASQ